MADTSNTSVTLALSMQHECDTSNTNARRVRHEWHECDTSVTRATWVGHEYYTTNKSATRVKTFDFDNDTGKNIFSRPYIYYMARDRQQEEEQFHTKN